MGFSAVILLLPAGSTVSKHGHGPLGSSTCNLKGTTSDIGEVWANRMSVFFPAMLTRQPWLNMPKRHYIQRAKWLLERGSSKLLHYLGCVYFRHSS